MPTAPDTTSLYHSSDGCRRAMDTYDGLLRQMAVPYETVWVETPHAVTHVLSAGPADAPPVVLWHGLDASAPTWVAQINTLARHYRVYAPDVPGSMGKSAPVRFDRKGNDYGRWMAETLDALGIKQAHMIGISNGGWLILKLANAAPDKIRGAILISSAGFVGASFRLVFKMLPNLLVAPLLSPEARARRFAAVMGAPGVPVAEQDMDMFRVLLSDFQYEQAPGALTDTELRALTAPTYLLMGEHEAAFSPQAVIRRARAVLPNLCAAEIVPGVGHGMITENPAEVNRRLMEFLGTRSIVSLLKQENPL